jgi:hypothetical protein
LKKVGHILELLSALSGVHILLNNLTLSSLSDISSAAMYVAFETHFQSFKSFSALFTKQNKHIKLSNFKFATQ